MSKKNPHACTARALPFPVAGAEFVSVDGKTITPAGSAPRQAPPKAAKQPAKTGASEPQEKTNG